MDAGHVTSDALKYPLKDFKKVVILGILTILSSLLIPGFLVLGYFFKVIKSSNDSSELPDFNEWITMFIDGLKVFTVLFIYSILPAILILMGMWVALLPMLTVPGEGSLLNPHTSISLVSGIALIGILLQIMISFIIPIALVNMAFKNDLSAAFRLKEVYVKIKEIGGVDYLIWYVIMLIIIGLLSYISFILIFPFFIGLIIVPLIVLPYLTIFLARSTTLICDADESSHEYYRHSKQIKYEN